MSGQENKALGPRRRLPVRWVLRGFAALLPLALVALLIYGVTAQSSNTTIDDSLSRRHTVPAPAFRLAPIRTGSLGPILSPRLTRVFARPHVALSDLRGTPLVLNFWASWCVPCQEEASTLERAWREQARRRGVLFLGLDMQDLTTDAGRFMSHYTIDYPNIRDPSNDVARRYGVTGVPETFFISAGGQVVGHVIGVSSTAQLTAGIASAASGQIQGARRGGAEGALK